MNLARAYTILLCFSFSLLSFVSFGQGTITIRATLDKNNIVIGEQVHLSLEADFPLHEPMRFFAIDSIPHFEILERRKVDTIDIDEGIKLSQVFTLTSFDSGHWVIPSYELAGDKPLVTDSIPVDVGFSPFDPNQDYHDIKDVIDVKAHEEKKQDWYWYIGITIMLVAAIVYFMTRKKKRPVAKKPPVDPFVEARQELEKLKKENPSSKIFYTRLVDIFRLYVSRRKGIASWQETTDDLVLQLRSLRLAEEQFNRLAQSLRLSDFVKFAKYEPIENDKVETFNVIRTTIEQVEAQEKKTELKKQS